jgi:hypothetical protein
MDYALRIVVEKVAISSQEVIKRDTIASYNMQCPTSIGELGLGHTEQRALLEKVQHRLLAEQSLLLAPAMPGCPICGNPPKKNGYKTPIFMPSLAIIPSASKNIPAVSRAVVGTVRPPSLRSLARISIRT